MWHRAVNVSRLAPLEIANSNKALTAPAATVNSRIAPPLQRTVMTLIRGVIPNQCVPC